jgi:hypothetical protein
MQSYGGHALVRRTPEGWKRVFYEHETVGDCTPIRSKSGRSRLVCLRVKGILGAYPVRLALVSYDQRTDGMDETVDPILQIKMRVTSPSPFVNCEAMSQEVTRHAVLGRSAYEAGDERALAIEVGVRSRPTCPGIVNQLPKPDNGPLDTTLRFAFDGAKFSVTPETRPAFERIMAREVE